MSDRRSAKHIRQYSSEYKEQAVRLARELGSGTAASVQLGIDRSVVSSWIRQSESAQSQGRGLCEVLDEKARNAQLERENASLREENEILKKATAYFAAAHLPRNTPGSNSIGRNSRSA